MEEAIAGVWYIPKQRANIEFFKKDNAYHGKIIQGSRRQRYDVNNPDPEKRKNLMVGTFIVKDVKFDGNNTWKGGSIYNPDNGKTYNCMIELIGEEKLKVTGYLGVSFFGKTQTWFKSSTKNISAKN